jgi:Uma2 family endonuclease
MAMPVLDRWTREQVLALPDDGNRYELFDGELVVTPSPAARHQGVITLLLERFVPYLGKNPVARLMLSPADLRLDGNQVAQPDLFVWPGRRMPQGWDAAPLPILAIEVLSPSTAHYDRALKRRYYQRAGVAEFWVVDADARLVERWCPGDERPEVLDREVAWQPAPGVAPLVIDLPAMFSELWGDP